MIKKIFSERLQMCYDALTEGADIEATGITKVINSPEELQECLSLVRSEKEQIQRGIADCDTKIDAWQQSKKAWKARLESLNTTLMETMTRLGMKSATDGDTKVTLTTKRGVNLVDPDILLKEYEKEIEAFKASLPSYVKVSVDIDKVKLASHLKQDETLLLTMPENIHYKDSKSIRIS